MKFNVIEIGENVKNDTEELIRACAVCPECGSYGDDLSFTFHYDSKCGILYNSRRIHAIIKCNECSCVFKSEDILTDKKLSPLKNRLHNILLIASSVLFVFSIVCLIFAVVGHRPVIAALLFATSFITSSILMILTCFID